MSFGYAIGDFIAGANLAYQLIHLMTETRGASDEYQEAMSELCSIQQAFIHVSQITRSSILPQATLNSASFIVLSSMQIIAKFLDRSKRYRKGLSDPNTGGVSASWCKVGWGLFKKDELIALRDSLHCRLVAINTLFAAANYSHALPSSISQYRVHDTTETNSLTDSAVVLNDDTSVRSTAKIDPDELERLVQERVAEEMQKRVAQEQVQAEATYHQIKEKHEKQEEMLRQKILAEAKAETEMKMVIKEGIKFKDAIGRKFSFPFHLVRTWEGMEELIKQAFIHVEVVGKEVQEGHYDLIGPDGEIVLPTVWEKTIEPGMAITMHMWPFDRIPRRPPMPARGGLPRILPPPPGRIVNVDSLEATEKSRVLGWFTSSLGRRKQSKSGSNSKAVQTAA